MPAVFQNKKSADDITKKEESEGKSQKNHILNPVHIFHATHTPNLRMFFLDIILLMKKIL